MSDSLQWTLQIDRSPADVYAYLADFTKHPEWSPKPYSVEILTDGPIGVGTKLRSKGELPGSKKAHDNEVTVTAADPGKKLAFTAVEDGQTFVNTFDLTANAAGTQLVRTLEFPEMKGALKLAFPMVKALVVKPAVQKGLNMLKANLESGAS
jgi:uncharacterized protein YndB with AHSA1/START domain